MVCFLRTQLKISENKYLMIFELKQSESIKVTNNMIDYENGVNYYNNHIMRRIHE